MNEIKTNALCIKTEDYKEADKMLTLLTPQGKIFAVARGVKKEKARLKNICQPFCLAEFLIAPRGKFNIITNATLLEQNASILKDYDVFEKASIILKIANQISYQLQDNEFLFLETVKCILNFSKSNNTYHCLNLYLSSILKNSGYQFDFSSCCKCGQKLNGGAFFDGNNFNCEKCFQKNSKLISNQCLQYINNLSNNILEIQTSDNIQKEAFDIYLSILSTYFDLSL